MRRRGFTLIELLAVIAIIAVLAAILFPVLHAAKAYALTSRCLSNCRQIGAAMLTYTGDWNEWLPRAAYNEWDEPPHPDQPCPYSGYESLLARYSKSWGIFYCPSQDDVRIDFGSEWRKFDPWHDPDQKGDVSYGVNLGVTWPDPNRTRPAGLKGGSRCMTDMPAASGTILLAESANGWHDVWDGSEQGLNPMIDAMDMLCRDRHGGRSVYLFCDGHTRTLLWSDTHSPHNLWTLNPSD